MNSSIQMAGWITAAAGLMAVAPVQAEIITLTPHTVGRITDFADYGSNVNNGSSSDDTVTFQATAAFGVNDHNSQNAANGRIQTPVIQYDISGHRAAIDAATDISFQITVTALGGSPRPVRLVGLADADGTITIADVAGGESLHVFDPASLSVGDTVNLDVTAYLKAASLDLNNDFVGFRLTFADLVDNLDGVVDSIRFGTVGAPAVELQIVPEPGALSLLGLGSMMLLRRKRC